MPIFDETKFNQMISRFVNLFMLLVLIVMLQGCSKDEDTPSADVYVYGSQNSIAMVWKNGQENPITNGSKTSLLSGGAISGSDIYFAGFEIVNGVKVAKYWKNGVDVVLSDGSKNEEAIAIAISGNDVVVAGYEYSTNSNWIGKYWKNGVATIISNNTVFTFVTGVAAVGSDVYVTGIESKADSVIGKYWKNGTANKVDKNAKISYAWGIAAQGSDIHIVGASVTSLGASIAKYWKNGVETILPNGSRASAIAISENDIYISGDNLGSIVYWKNSQVNSLAGEANTYSEANGIFVSKGDFYVTGAISEITGGQKGSLLWKNGMLEEPFAATKNTMIAKGVVVLSK